jgi:1-phosphatidylinositol-3-phosphate 5-kinase
VLNPDNQPTPARFERTATEETVKRQPQRQRAASLARSDVSDRRGSSVSRGAAKGKAHVRRISKEKQSTRVFPTVSVKGAARRIAPPASGSKVSHLTSTFEQISRDNDKEDKRRYAIMKGRRARPVARSTGKVKIFDNLLEAARDESEEGSEASSEADDEDEADGDGDGDGDGNDERKGTTASPEEQSARPEPVLPPLLILDKLSEIKRQDDDTMVDLTSPVTSRPAAGPLARGSTPIDAPTVIVSSRPPSPVPNASPLTQAGSSYVSGHSESEYSVGGAAERQSVINTIAGYSWFSWMREPTPSFSNLKYPA